MKREQNLKAFHRGLNCLNIGKLIKKHSEVMRSLFVAQKGNVITADIFFSLMSNDHPVNEHEERAFNYFKAFVVNSESE